MRIGSGQRRFLAVAVILYCATASWDVRRGAGEGHAIRNASADTIPPMISFFGDSTTKGEQTIAGRLINTVNNEPDIVQSMLQARFGPTVVVDNQGVGGTEAAQLLNGTDGIHAAFARVMAASPAKIVVLNFALNDSYYSEKPKAGVPSESVSDYWSNMAQLCLLARQYGKICVLEEPNPVDGVEISNAPIYGYVYVLRQIASQLDAPLVPQFDQFRTLPNWRSWLSEDQTHPTDAGYAYKAANTEAVLRPIVAHLLGASRM
ncbi:GDSL family lipase [Burkholderia multivorans]|uniref:GDSL family lipase n=1 Tax=Burkholderia multivorans TaxID=87883 RepID=A0ABD7LK11_9BURK|nr:SGNH/GDSL hydrolase family protein [Burkholderia multivorans]MBU9671769.1 SGNH/GDSL hydrolase family protein [Burkholderia multivorans]PRE07736.1 SGNH/GDSL hydrolase family protein [Burkholderia multivorans]SAK21663.1 GDSL family lipase [Burkholderia multivorans]HEF4757513.1 SGNH/GDSL hydrolase family protein [Burkholderia multivorans]